MPRWCRCLQSQCRPRPHTRTRTNTHSHEYAYATAPGPRAQRLCAFSPGFVHKILWLSRWQRNNSKTVPLRPGPAPKTGKTSCVFSCYCLRSCVYVCVCHVHTIPRHSNGRDLCNWRWLWNSFCAFGVYFVRTILRVFFLNNFVWLLAIAEMNKSSIIARRWHPLTCFVPYTAKLQTRKYLIYMFAVSVNSDISIRS